MTTVATSPEPTPHPRRTRLSKRSRGGSIDVSVVEGDAVLVGGHVVSILQVEGEEVFLRIIPQDQFDGFDAPVQTAGIDPERRRRFDA